MDYLPSTKFIKIVSTAIGVILGGWLILYSVNRFGFFAKNIPLTSQEIASAKAYDVVSKDSDNDGLKDWEEAIWNTDPKNPDTDGDGTSDGEEIALHRDPTIPNTAGPGKTPNDYLAGYEQESLAINNLATSTLTSQLSANFLTRYLVSKGLNSGAALDNQQKTTLNVALNQDFQNTLSNYHQDEFSQKDIIISTRKSPKEYINDLAWADSTFYKGLTTFELSIFKNAVATKDPSQLSALDVYINASAKHVAFLKKEPTPASYAEIHLTILNSVNNLKYADEKMKNFEQDPLGAIAGAQYFALQTEQFINILKNLKKQIDYDGIIFSPNDLGVQFYKLLPAK